MIINWGLSFCFKAGAKAGKFAGKISWMHEIVITSSNSFFLSAGGAKMAKAAKAAKGGKGIGK